MTRTCPPASLTDCKDVFPQALHVSQVDLSRALDEVLWDYARANALVICTKDTDFLDMSVLNGFPAPFHVDYSL